MKYRGGLVEVTSAFEAMWETLRDDKTRASLRGKGLLEQSKISRKPFPGPPDSPDARGPDRHGPGTHQPQLVIFRVWPDYPMYAQIDRSARTVSSKLRSWLLRPSQGGAEDPADAHLQQQLAATTQRATTDRHPPPRIGEREHGPSTVAPTLCKQGVRGSSPLGSTAGQRTLSARRGGPLSRPYPSKVLRWKGWLPAGVLVEAIARLVRGHCVRRTSMTSGEKNRRR